MQRPLDHMWMEFIFCKSFLVILPFFCKFNFLQSVSKLFFMRQQQLHHYAKHLILRTKIMGLFPINCREWCSYNFCWNNLFNECPRILDVSIGQGQAPENQVKSELWHRGLLYSLHSILGWGEVQSIECPRCEILYWPGSSKSSEKYNLA